jgi:hypothetical protein
MSKITKIILVAIFGFTSCMEMSKTARDTYKYELYIDYKYISFQGRNSTQDFYFTIDSTNGMWYHGKLIIDRKDTLLLHGFEKGSSYPTTYTTRTSSSGHIEIWSRGPLGQIRDSLTIEDRDEGNGKIKKKAVLYRQPRR